MGKTYIPIEELLRSLKRKGRLSTSSYSYEESKGQSLKAEESYREALNIAVGQHKINSLYLNYLQSPSWTALEASESQHEHEKETKNLEKKLIELQQKLALHQLLESDEIVKEFIKRRKLTLLDCIKFNPVKNIQQISIFGIFISILSLVLSFFFSAHILTPYSAILGLVASIGFYFMAKIEEKIQKSKEK